MGILVGMANEILYVFLYQTSIDPKAAQTLTKLQLFVKISTHVLSFSVSFMFGLMAYRRIA